MKPRKQKLGGYSYTLTDEQIKKYMALPVEMRLQWLEEAEAARHTVIRYRK